MTILGRSKRSLLIEKQKVEGTGAPVRAVAFVPVAHAFTTPDGSRVIQVQARVVQRSPHETGLYHRCWYRDRKNCPPPIGLLSPWAELGGVKEPGPLASW